MPLCKLYTSETGEAFDDPALLVLHDRFRDDVIWIEVGYMDSGWGSFHNLSYDNLANLMTNTPKRLNKIDFLSSDTSPEFLRFVSVASQKTRSMIFHDPIDNPLLCSCLNAALVEGGIEEFGFKLFGLPSRELAVIAIPLFQGIALSPSLQKLEITMESSGTLGNHIVRALEQNQTLKTLQMFSFSPTEGHHQGDNRMIQKIFRTTIQSTRVSELILKGNAPGNNRAAAQLLDQRVFMDCLCDPSCAIEKLHLNRLKLLLRDESNPSDELECHFNSIDDNLVHGRGEDGERLENPEESLIARETIRKMKQASLAALDKKDASEEAAVAVTNNTSVKTLHITNAELRSLQLRKILPRFKSLVDLDLFGNKLWNVSPVIKMLPSLHTLGLQGNIIDEDDIEALLTELPNVTSLKSLNLSVNPCIWSSGNKFLNKPWAEALENAALRNTTIERLTYCHMERNDEIREFLSQYDKKKIKAHLSINRGGRSYLQKCDDDLPPSLWPLILERAMKLEYCGPYGFMTETDTRKDAVYWLLREQVLIGSSKI